MNVIAISGHMGTDPEVREKSVALNVATRRRIRIDGEWTSVTDWHKVSVAGPRRGWASRFRKGDVIAITGSLRVITRAPSEAFPGGYRDVFLWAVEVDGKPSGHDLTSDSVPDGWEEKPAGLK